MVGKSYHERIHQWCTVSDHLSMSGGDDCYAGSQDLGFYTVP